jgi:hypothetical protein
LAFVMLGARLVRSCIHLASAGPRAVTLRFVAFALQMGIAAVWAVSLLAALRT